MNYALDPAIVDSNIFNSVSKELRKDSRSVRNRLKSIAQDSAFVCDVADSYGLPLVANERCGRWYIPPERIDESVYFKSTDGHTGQWGFSQRRLNIHIIDLVATRNGVVIVDSTRRGKRMPDALSKTVPIWCAVINRAVFSDTALETKLHTSPIAVSASEHSQIKAKINFWTEQFINSGVNIKQLKTQLCKPLRPIWITPDSSLPLSPPEFEEFYAIVLCTASRMVLDGTERRQGFTYVQGAADDHEEWASILTPSLFWDNRQILLNSSDDEIEKLILSNQLVVAGNNLQKSELDLSQITNNLTIGKHTDLSYVAYAKYDTIIDLSTAHTSLSAEELAKRKIFKLAIPSGKKGSKQFRNDLELIQNFYKQAQPSELLIVCDTGNDFSVGAALAINVLHFTGSGELKDSQHEVQRIDKEFIRKRLTQIILHRKVNPSRATLQAVNAFLMGWTT
ncbi:tRNA A64-2'-O-ribosylphosphate transferase [Lipomyces japonicus]|uniref:tRNA A64-2'-O-ribosylphosphate transferase n=1 Tax=Lipomyces japonicus TaxID=56871 RepID=UPI0034CE413E